MDIGLKLETEIAGPNIATLTYDDAVAYYELVDRNREHLTRLGDYRSVRTASLQSVQDELSANSPNVVTGIWLSRDLIGRIDLIPKDPGTFVIGYWIDENAQGYGYMTAACRALISFAREHLDARSVYAGVTKGNQASVALLARLGFAHVADMGAYNRYRLHLAYRNADRAGAFVSQGRRVRLTVRYKHIPIRPQPCLQRFA